MQVRPKHKFSPQALRSDPTVCDWQGIRSSSRRASARSRRSAGRRGHRRRSRRTMTCEFWPVVCLQRTSYYFHGTQVCEHGYDRGTGRVLDRVCSARAAAALSGTSKQVLKGNNVVYTQVRMLPRYLLTTATYTRNATPLHNSTQGGRSRFPPTLNNPASTSQLNVTPVFVMAPGPRHMTSTSVENVNPFWKTDCGVVQLSATSACGAGNGN